MTPYFLCLHVFKWRAIKSFDTIIFVSWNFIKSCQRKAEFLITMRAIKSFDTIFLCLHVFKFHKFLSQNKRPNFVSQWEQSKILTSYFLSLLSFDFSWSFSKKRGNDWWYFDAKTVIQRTPLKLIYFLTFDEASAKTGRRLFMNLQ